MMFANAHFDLPGLEPSSEAREDPDAGTVALWWVAGPGDYGRFVFASSRESAVDLFAGLAGLPITACTGERAREAVGVVIGQARLASPRELAVLGARDVRLSREEQFLMMDGRLYMPRLFPLPLESMAPATSGAARPRVRP